MYSVSSDSFAATGLTKDQALLVGLTRAKRTGETVRVMCGAALIMVFGGWNG